MNYKINLDPIGHYHLKIHDKMYIYLLYITLYITFSQNLNNLKIVRIHECIITHQQIVVLFIDSKNRSITNLNEIESNTIKIYHRAMEKSCKLHYRHYEPSYTEDRQKFPSQ